jgi:gas vesicle protein
MAEEKGTGLLEVTIAFLLGAVVGVSLGLLFAPASGAETRKKLQELAQRATEKVKETYEELTVKEPKGL